MQTYKTAPVLIPAEQQRSHHDFLTPLQLENAMHMGVKGLTTSNTQYDLLKLVRFQFERKRSTSNHIKNLCKKHGRKVAKFILRKVLK